MDRILFSKCTVAECVPHEANQTCSYGETPFPQSRSIIFSNNFLETLDYQDLDPRIDNKGFSVDSSSTGVQLSIGILIDELKPGVSGKIQFEIWIESFSLNVRLLIVSLMKEIKPVVTQKHLFHNRDQSFLVTTFWKIWTIKILIQGSITKVFQSIPPLQQYSFQFRF